MRPSSRNLLSVLSFSANALALLPVKHDTFSTDCATNLDHDGGTWNSDLPPIPRFPRQEHITIAIPPSSLMILGGIVPSTDSNGTIIPGSWTTANLVQQLDTKTYIWVDQPPLPIPLNHVNAAYVDGKVYVLSGLAVDTDGSWRGTDRSWVLDLQPNIPHGKMHRLSKEYKKNARAGWKELPRLPTGLVPRGSAAVGIHKGKIYLAGGMTVLQPWEGGQQDSVSSVLVFDTKKDKWVSDRQNQVPDLPEPRDHMGTAVIDGTMYVVGGRDHGQLNVRNTVFALDISNERAVRKGWVIRKGKVPTPRGGLAAASIGERIYTFGGEGNLEEGSSGVFNQTEVYNVRTDTWEGLGPMKLPRHGTSAVAVDGKVYIPGGGVQIGAGPVGTVDVFVPCLAEEYLQA
ncbi:hypothetical protein V8F20_002825 [Naviculisporaceae sp. PSN 640]